MSLTSKRPHVVLLAAVAAAVILEVFRGSGTLGTSETWPLLQAVVTGGALVVAWRGQERLRLAPLLTLALALELGFVVVHLALGVQSDFDSARVYPREGEALLHGHCHQKAIVGTAPTVNALTWAGYKVSEVDSGCCGMAGSFGFEREHYDVSVTLGNRRLAPAVRSAAAETEIVAPGISCRQQIEHLTDRRAIHPAEALRSRLA